MCQLCFNYITVHAASLTYMDEEEFNDMWLLRNRERVYPRPKQTFYHEGNF